MSKKPVGVLVMAYGTPHSLNDVEAYYTHIRHGRPPTPELLNELVSRYQAIGGVSPLNEITEAQAQGLEDLLNQGQTQSEDRNLYRVYLGMKHTTPFIEEAVRQMAEDGVEEAVSLVLAPHFSTMSVGGYQKTAREAATGFGTPVLYPIEQWHLEPGFLDLLANRVKESLAAFADPAQVMVVFTAHSLPEKILLQGDPYAQQLRETGNAVATRLGLPNYMFGWQSAGRTQDAWLGPDILDVLKDLRAENWNHVLVCPAGFVSDHLEVLYDLDIEAARLAKQLGMTFARTRSLNSDGAFLKTLAELVRARHQAGRVHTH